MSADLDLEEELARTPLQRATLKRLFGYAAPHRRALALVMALEAVWVVSMLVEPAVVRGLVDGPLQRQPDGSFAAGAAATADVLLGVFRGRSGQLENTTFALMDPGGTRVLGQAGRGPAFLVGGARGPGQATSAAEVARFAARLNEVAGQYKPRAEITALPQALDVRRALVVAACDGQAVLVVRIQEAYGTIEEDECSVPQTRS